MSKIKRDSGWRSGPVNGCDDLTIYREVEFDGATTREVCAFEREMRRSLSSFDSVFRYSQIDGQTIYISGT